MAKGCDGEADAKAMTTISPTGGSVTPEVVGLVEGECASGVVVAGAHLDSYAYRIAHRRERREWTGNMFERTERE